jgi:ABC-type sugar transport system ATPase subunit
MVCQSSAVYPHKTVRENLGFGLRVRRVAAGDIDARVRKVAASLQIEDLLDRRPAQLSGGQRQRVALGRAIVREPQAFLFDEPLSNLDPALRLETRTQIALLHRRLGATMVYVTHDQEEAMKLGQRVVLLRDGRVEQAGTPMEIYRRPATLFAARFLGSPPMNIMDAAQLDAGKPGLIGIRPQDIVLSSPDAGDLVAIVELVEPAGSEQHVHLRLEAVPDQRLVAVVPADVHLEIDARTGVQVRRDRLHVFSL